MAESARKLPWEEMRRRQRERIAAMTPEFVERHRGEVIVADLLSHDYEAGDDVLAASRALSARRPNGATLAWRVGDTVLTRIGGFRARNGE